MSGRTGGSRVEAPATLARSAVMVTLRERIASIDVAHAGKGRLYRSKFSQYMHEKRRKAIAGVVIGAMMSYQLVKSG